MSPLSPTRPDGWPDWLGRRPIPIIERDRLRQTIDADRLSRETARAQPDQQLAPHFSYIVIEGLNPGRHPANAPGSPSLSALPPEKTTAPTTGFWDHPVEIEC